MLKVTHQGYKVNSRLHYISVKNGVYYVALEAESHPDHLILTLFIKFVFVTLKITAKNNEKNHIVLRIVSANKQIVLIVTSRM